MYIYINRCNRYNDTKKLRSAINNLINKRLIEPSRDYPRS